LSPFRISRCSGFRAVRDFAPFGIPRRLEFGAVRHFALFKQFAPLDAAVPRGRLT